MDEHAWDEDQNEANKNKPEVDMNQAYVMDSSSFMEDQEC